jgi:hypothetical protein
MVEGGRHSLRVCCRVTKTVWLLLWNVSWLKAEQYFEQPLSMARLFRNPLPLHNWSPTSPGWDIDFLIGP